MASKLSEKSASKSIDDLRAAHDKKVVIPNLIKAAIAALAASPKPWAYESDFRNLCKPPLNATDLSRYRDQFSDYWADLPPTHRKTTPGRVWFESKKFADEWKESISG